MATPNSRVVRYIASHTVFVNLPMNLEYFSSGSHIPLRRSTNRLRGQAPTLMLFLL